MSGNEPISNKIENTESNGNTVPILEQTLYAGTNTFFLPQSAGYINKAFMQRIYRSTYSAMGGIPLNYAGLIKQYKRVGIRLKHYVSQVNGSPVRYNWQLYVKLNNLPESTTEAQAINSFLTTGICTNAAFDIIPTKICSEGDFTFPFDLFDVLDIDDDDTGILDSCRINRIPFNFFSDVFDASFYICNYSQQMAREGYPLNRLGAIQHYINEGIYTDNKINSEGYSFDWKYFLQANGLGRLKTKEEAILYFFQFGVCDQNIKIAPPKLQSCASENLSLLSYPGQNKFASLLDNRIQNIVNSNCDPCTSNVNTTNCSNSYSSNTNNNNCENSYQYTLNFSGNNYTRSTRITNRSQYLQSNSCSNSNSNSNFNTKSNSCASDIQQQQVLNELNCNNTSNIASSGSGIASTSFGSCKGCGSNQFSTASATLNNSSNTGSQCPNCLSQISAFTPVNNKMNFVTPLTVTANPSGVNFSGSNTNSVLLSPNAFDSSGNFNTNSTFTNSSGSGSGTVGISSVSILNGSYSGSGSGCGCGSSNRFQPSYNPNNLPTFSNVYNKPYFG